MLEQFENEIDLGGSDCETCGWSYDRLVYGYDPEGDWYAPNAGGWFAIISVGCYGGSSIYGASREEFVAFLEDWDHIPEVRAVWKAYRG